MICTGGDDVRIAEWASGGVVDSAVNIRAACETGVDEGWVDVGGVGEGGDVWKIDTDAKPRGRMRPPLALAMSCYARLAARSSV